MDIKREPPKKRGKYILIGVGVAVLGITTVALGNLEQRAPSVDRATLWIDSVQRGTMTRQVRAPGTLTPEHIRYVVAVTSGRVEVLPVRPGVTVTPSTLLLELSNPDVQLEALESERQLTVSRAEQVNLGANLASQRLSQEAQVAAARAAYLDAKRNAEAAESLAAKQLISANEASRIHDQVEELGTRYKVEQERLGVMTSAADSQLSLQQAQVDRLRDVNQFQRGRVRSMVVMAGANGILQELPLEVGQWAQSGATLARIVEPGRLKAVLRIPETQAKDVTIGQPAAIDTRNGIATGKVMRIDPAVQNGTVTVDVSLAGELPRGARPDLSVDGTVQIERLNNVLHVGRPAFGQAGSTVGLFKLTPDGKEAVRTTVRLGRTSVNTVEVLGGLQQGEKVIISDMSRWDGVDRVRVE